MNDRQGWFAPQIHREHYRGPLFAGWRLRAWLDLNCEADFTTGEVRMTRREMVLEWDANAGSVERWLSDMAQAGYVELHALGSATRAGRAVIIPFIRDRASRVSIWSNVWSKDGPISGPMFSSNGAGEQGVDGPISEPIVDQCLDHVVRKEEVTKKEQITTPLLRNGPVDTLDESQPGGTDETVEPVARAGHADAAGVLPSAAGSAAFRRGVGGAARSGSSENGGSGNPAGATGSGVEAGSGATPEETGGHDQQTVGRLRSNGRHPRAGDGQAPGVGHLGHYRESAFSLLDADAPHANGNGAIAHADGFQAPPGPPEPGSCRIDDSRASVALTLIVVEPEPEPDPDRVLPNKLLAAWIDLQQVKPSRRAVGMQAAAAKRICDQYGRAEITAAWEGMGLIFPYAPRPVGKGERWSLTDMERRFHDAAAKAVESHPAVKRMRADDELQRMRERLKARGYTDAELG